MKRAIKKNLTVVICTYNRLSFLQRCINELAVQIQRIGDEEIRVVVVDNNCTDGTFDYISEFATWHPWLTITKEVRQGLSYARNCGANFAGYDANYICYLDDDALPSLDYLKSVICIIKRHQPDVFGGPVFPFYSSNKPFWFQDALETRQYTKKSGFADCSISGGNFIIRAKLLQQLGGFSTEFGMLGSKLRLGEEKELLERYRAGRAPDQRRIYYAQECFIYHHVPAHKMTLSYLAYRAFHSGRMVATIKNKNSPTYIENYTKPNKKNVLGKLRLLLLGSKGIYLPLRILHFTSMAFGMTYQRLLDARRLMSTISRYHVK